MNLSMSRSVAFSKYLELNGNVTVRGGPLTSTEYWSLYIMIIQQHVMGFDDSGHKASGSNWVDIGLATGVDDIEPGIVDVDGTDIGDIGEMAVSDRRRTRTAMEYKHSFGFFDQQFK